MDQRARPTGESEDIWTDRASSARRGAASSPFGGPDRSLGADPPNAGGRENARRRLAVGVVTLAALAGLVFALAASGLLSASDERVASGPSRASAKAAPTVREQAPATTASPAPVVTTPEPELIPAASWEEDLRLLKVEEPMSRAGYDRSLFEHWIDVDSNGCDTRCEVLLREFRQDLIEAPAGGWLSVYDGVVTSESSDLDVDHTVALSEAWVSGAHLWDEQRRRDFANDLTPGALRAVTASVNRSKSDRDPAEWQPPNRSSWCGYAADWIRTKNRWGLSADPLEFTALSEMLRGCP